jgi:hypothetical protein
MSLATAELPEDIAALRAFALACQGELKAAQLAVQVKALEIAKLRFQIAKLRRMQFGRSSERITRQIEQLELQLQELETGEAEDIARMEASEPVGPIPERIKPKRKPLPDHLPRHEVLHEPEAGGACICPACGGGMGRLGEDVTEVLDYVPGYFQVIRHVRPKYACQACDVITQAPVPCGTFRQAQQIIDQIPGPDARRAAGVELPYHPVVKPRPLLRVPSPPSLPRSLGVLLRDGARAGRTDFSTIQNLVPLHETRLAGAAGVDRMRACFGSRCRPDRPQPKMATTQNRSSHLGSGNDRRSFAPNFVG